MLSLACALNRAPVHVMNRWHDLPLIGCRVEPVDFAKESTLLLDLINRLTLNQPILQPPAQGGAFAGRQQGGVPGTASSLL